MSGSVDTCGSGSLVAIRGAGVVLATVGGLATVLAAGVVLAAVGGLVAVLAAGVVLMTVGGLARVVALTGGGFDAGLGATNGIAGVIDSGGAAIALGCGDRVGVTGTVDSTGRDGGVGSLAGGDGAGGVDSDSVMDSGRATTVDGGGSAVGSAGADAVGALGDGVESPNGVADGREMRGCSVGGNSTTSNRSGLGRRSNRLPVRRYPQEQG
ncbi:MAG: hypothetical protein U1F42_02310 [Candidatus Competibacteraceae bacterium]